MNNTEKRCISIKTCNADSIDKMVKEKKYKNFSQAIDSIVEDKMQEQMLDNCNLDNIPRDITFVNVAKKIAKELK